MRLTKANIAGLASPLQRAEMKSILAGTWPPLRPLPVFKYETAEYRATIAFDKKLGEWACRKTSLPSNKVQELRGGLREITMALPHGEAEILTEDAEPQEQELERDANRRLQAIDEWRENYQSGALYFELRDYLSESQRTEIDDSLRLSLTARQLQCNSKNVAYVFDALSTAGGRFAMLVEFAKRNKAKQRTGPRAQQEGIEPEEERATDHGQQSAGVSSHEVGRVFDNRFVRDQEAAERCTEADELPAVSIKNVFPEQDEASPAEHMTAHTASHQFEIDTAEIVDADSAASLVENPYQERHHSPAFNGLGREVRTSPSSADRIEGSSPRFPALELSAFQVAVLALLSLLAVIAFTVGLTVGRGRFGRRLREAPKPVRAADSKSPALADQADESTSRAPTPSVASFNDSGGTYSLDATPSGQKSRENIRGSGDFAQLRSTDSTPESQPSAKAEVNSEHSGAIDLIAPRSPALPRLTPTIGTAPHAPRSPAILVTVPGRGSRPFRVSFPEKAVAATSSFAMTSQFSVLVYPELGPAAAGKPARLEAGELVSFVWPRYRRPGHGSAETIRVRATIGPIGQVLDVKFLKGSLSLLPATMRAIRQWRYKPTLFDKRPVQAQQDVTIEFRPPQYASRLSTPHPSHD